MHDKGTLLFVSHVTEDRAAAMSVVAMLEARGIACWIAPRDITPGTPYDDAIADAIDECAAMLLIFSERCNDSDYIRREVTVAGEARKLIIPFRIEDVQPRKGLRIRLIDLHWIDAFVSAQAAIETLMESFARTTSFGRNTVTAPPVLSTPRAFSAESKPNAVKSINRTSAPGDLPVVVSGPMSGSLDFIGRSLLNGAEFSATEINEAGGVLGRKLSVVAVDDADGPKSTLDEIERLQDPGPVLVVGHVQWQVAKVACEAYSDRELILISPGVTAPIFTDRRPRSGIYRLCGRDDQQGPFLAKYIVRRFGSEPVAVVHDRDAFGVGVASDLLRSLNAAGKSPAFFEVFDAGLANYKELAVRLHESKCRAVFVGGLQEEIAKIKLALSEITCPCIVLAPYSAGSLEYRKLAADAANGTIFADHPAVEDIVAAQQTLTSMKRNGIAELHYAVYAYAALQVWVQALSHAKTLSFKDIQAVMDNTEFQTALGQFRFDPKGDTTREDWCLYEWVGEERRLLELRG